MPRQTKLKVALTLGHRHHRRADRGMSRIAAEVSAGGDDGTPDDGAARGRSNPTASAATPLEDVKPRGGMVVAAASVAMPPSGEILNWATAVANEWRALAMWWHAALTGLLAAVALGWRPSTRLLGGLLLSPLVSVSALAWASGNPFNGLTFAVLAAALATVAVGLPIANVRIASWSRVAPGAWLVLFGWVYPHFVESQSWISLGVAAPLGLIPCPTLSAVIGLTLTFDLLGSKPWSWILAAFGVAYGLIGLLVLGVWIDVFLLAGGVVLGVEAGGRHHRVVTIHSSEKGGYSSTSSSI